MIEKALTNKKIALCASRKIEEMSTLIVKQGGIPILRPAQGTMFFNEELKQKLFQMVNEPGVSQDFVENIFSVHYGCCQSLVSEPFSGIDIVSAFGLSSLILK
ncbi:hypothetical protein LH47_02884 [Anoxybacillus thermarum]|uniref:Uncharacterized protein n=1 Tax=Anoxybacillus thermarum TaxID=404937 RepID=A0A0D0RWJ2_9BACL|nr:hypothetical protein LH47_02884 [Anoxybacillus thermarum]